MRDPEIPHTLGLQIVPDRGGIVGLIPTGGGFMLNRACAADLYRQIGVWLAANPAPAETPAEVAP